MKQVIAIMSLFAQEPEIHISSNVDPITDGRYVRLRWDSQQYDHATTDEIWDHLFTGNTPESHRNRRAYFHVICTPERFLIGFSGPDFSNSSYDFSVAMVRINELAPFSVRFEYEEYEYYSDNRSGTAGVYVPLAQQFEDRSAAIPVAYAEFVRALQVGVTHMTLRAAGTDISWQVQDEPLSMPTDLSECVRSALLGD